MRSLLRNYRLPLGQSILTLLILFGLHAAYMRRLEGWGTQTPLKEVFPWGLSAGLDVFGGLGLAVGGFAVAAVISLLNLPSYRPVLRASLLIAFLGFVMATLATVANRPIRLGPIATMWSPRWVLLGAGGAFVVYAALLALEFAPALSRPPGSAPPLPLRVVISVIAVAAALTSALHQSSFAKLFVLAPRQFSLLWLTPMLPALLLLSSACACLALVVFASHYTELFFGRGLQLAALVGLGKVLGVLTCLYLWLRCADLLDVRIFPLLAENHLPNYLLALELGLFLLPALLLIRPRSAARPQVIYWCCVMIIAGFVSNRLNTAITAREAVAGVSYIPQGNDCLIAFGIIALAIALFMTAAKHLPLFSTSS